MSPGHPQSLQLELAYFGQRHKAVSVGLNSKNTVSIDTFLEESQQGENNSQLNCSPCNKRHQLKQCEIATAVGNIQ